MRPGLVVFEDLHWYGSRRAASAAANNSPIRPSVRESRAIEFGETGVRLARECGDRVVLGQSLFRLGQSYHALGEYRQAILLLEQGLEFNANELRHDRDNLSIIPSVLNRTWLAIALVECGDLSTAMRQAKRALEIAERAEHQLSELLG
jgi:tetratricopeptide (TPR) repeat protein